MLIMNLYHVLELDNNATSHDIKKSYRRLAKIYHPDKNNGKDEEFKKLQLAYEILSDIELKKDYDAKYNIDKPYDLLQNIIVKNKLNIINSIFGYIYEDNEALKDDINNFNFINIYKNVKTKFNLDINNDIFVELKDIYFSKSIKIIIKRKINEEFKNFSLNIKPDIYDEELEYENLGDEKIFIKGKLVLKIKLVYDPEIYYILDDYNLLVNVNNINFKLFDKIDLKGLDKEIYFENEEFIIYRVKGYGFLNNDTNENGDLLIKINNI